MNRPMPSLFAVVEPLKQSPDDTLLGPSWEIHTQNGKPDSISVSLDFMILFSGSSYDTELA